MENTERNWGAEAGREPDVESTDTILFSECGRIIGHIDYRSHYYRLVKSQYGTISLLVKHGGGQEKISEFMLLKIVSAMQALDSDNRYLLMYAIYQSYSNGKSEGSTQTEIRYRNAFATGRLKKRKMPKQNRFKIWIEPKPLEVA